MWGRALTIALVATAVATAPAAAAPEAVQTLRYRLAGAPWELGTSSECPEGSARYGIVAPAGQTIGTATICVLGSSKRDRADGGPIVTQQVLETDAFARGWLRTRSTHV